ncbi:DNA polymerase IV [Desulfobacter hydrogenophilus]|uniref:DNA polymerase IV n=1 Tax=Desulfobacter hydrogenophilus TaxID=2291 RepID=A0A328FIJ1_9BACT|nr:DNA polymerase IV [Desulfobacter hydrogenophilus]NDY74061.1 DNA polymerase IV [Desulfobacter hydrogenophilus]QBH13429.1 DNA polymerase IV [Desulfobacter hydrogenophilus]RAM03680.1 DNA polymerase IV [Desulfobacter hydrogenophilus]
MILHVDMDAFFASVEQRDNPNLLGKPVIVAGHSSRSVVSAASYEARKFGIHSAMPVFQARQKCPHLIIQPGSREKYARDSRKIMAILRQFSPLVEPVSIDEAFLDITGCEKLIGTPEQAAKKIKTEIVHQLALTCSVGAAPVRFLAKIASDMNKPDGMTIISPEAMTRVIDTLPISKVPGVGAKAMAQMHRLQIETLGDVRKFDPKLLNNKFGSLGQRLFQLAQGIDTTPIEPERPRKSISGEVTLSRDISHPRDVQSVLLAQAHRVGNELRTGNQRCKKISIKLKFSDFSQITRSKTLDTWISSSNAIFDQALFLYYNVKITKKIRLVGVGVSEFQDSEAPMQRSLFTDENQINNRQWEAVDRAMDSVLAKFGPDALKKANLKNQKFSHKYIGDQKVNPLCAVEVTITGRVQGVCFRHETQLAAKDYRLSGHVRNMPDGSVQALFQGEQENIQEMLAWCRKGATFSEVKDINTRTISVDPALTHFDIRY